MASPQWKMMPDPQDPERPMGSRARGGNSIALYQTGAGLPSAQGPALQGPAVQGSAVQGSAVQGPVVQGPALQDLAVQDLAVPIAPKPKRPAHPSRAPFPLSQCRPV